MPPLQSVVLVSMTSAVVAYDEEALLAADADATGPCVGGLILRGRAVACQVPSTGLWKQDFPMVQDHATNLRATSARVLQQMNK